MSAGPAVTVTDALRQLDINIRTFRRHRIVADPRAAAPGPAAAPRPAAAARPIRTNRSFNLQLIDAQYQDVVDLVNAGSTIVNALEQLGLKMRSFRRYRTIAEARLVDLTAFERILERGEPTLEDLVTEGKRILRQNRARLFILFGQGRCLRRVV